MSNKCILYWLISEVILLITLVIMAILITDIKLTDQILTAISIVLIGGVASLIPSYHFLSKKLVDDKNGIKDLKCNL